jgi:hypothetical protein
LDYPAKAEGGVQNRSLYQLYRFGARMLEVAVRKVFKHLSSECPFWGFEMLKLLANNFCLSLIKRLPGRPMFSPIADSCLLSA